MQGRYEYMDPLNSTEQSNEKVINHHRTITVIERNEAGVKGLRL